MKIQGSVYHKVRNTHLPSIAFYIMKSPFLLYHLIMDRILKVSSHYDEVVGILNALRIETDNYDKVDGRNRHTFKCYYRYDGRNIYVKCRFFRKVDEEEYERFRNSLDIHTDYGISNLSARNGYFYFVVYIKMEPLYEYCMNQYDMSIGTYYEGLLQWNFSKYPHMLVIGETGQGKSVYIRYLLRAIFKQEYDIWCVDGKKVDYSKIRHHFTRYVANSTDKSEIIDILHEFRNEMQDRYDQMVLKGIYNYFEDSTLDPVFLLIDEYLMIVETATKKESDAIKSLISEIIWLGRAAGYFLIITMQRADAKYIDGAIRDNFACRVAVGKASKESYSMIFGKNLKGFEIGRAWVQMNNALYIVNIPFYKDFE